MIIPFVPGQDATASFVNDRLDDTRKCLLQATDQTVTSSITNTASTYLTFNLLAGATYSVDTVVIYDTNSTANFRLWLTCPTGALGRFTGWGAATAAVTSTINVQAADATGTPNVLFISMSGVAVGTMMSARVTGIISVNTAGTFTVGFSQNTSNASNTILKTGTWVAMCRVF